MLTSDIRAILVSSGGDLGHRSYLGIPSVSLDMQESCGTSLITGSGVRPQNLCTHWGICANSILQMRRSISSNSLVMITGHIGRKLAFGYLSFELY